MMNGLRTYTDAELVTALGQARAMGATASADALLREMGRRVADEEILERYHRFGVQYARQFLQEPRVSLAPVEHLPGGGVMA